MPQNGSFWVKFDMLLRQNYYFRTLYSRILVNAILAVLEDDPADGLGLAQIDYEEGVVPYPAEGGSPVVATGPVLALVDKEVIVGVPADVAD